MTSGLRNFFSISAAAVTVLLLLAGAAHGAVLKIATIAPEGSEWMKEHREAARLISERTEGRVELRFYGGGVMGNDKKVLRKVRIGQLQGGAFTISGLAERYPDIILYGLPFLFRSQAEVDYVRERMDADIAAGLEKAGFVSFGFAGGGFANFMGNSPITSQSSLRGKKIWVPEGDAASFSALESMNLAPVVLPLADVMTGLQTGLLDVIVTPPVGALLLQWYTRVNYINPMPVAYTVGLMAIDKRAFERLDAADQAVVTEVMAATYQRLEQINRKDNLEALEVLLNNGLQQVESNQADIPYWQSVADETNQRIWSQSALDPDLYTRLLSLLQEFRSAAGQPVAAVTQ